MPLASALGEQGKKVAQAVAQAANAAAALAAALASDSPTQLALTIPQASPAPTRGDPAMKAPVGAKTVKAIEDHLITPHPSKTSLTDKVVDSYVCNLQQRRGFSNRGHDGEWDAEAERVFNNWLQKPKNKESKKDSNEGGGGNIEQEKGQQNKSSREVGAAEETTKAKEAKVVEQPTDSDSHESETEVDLKGWTLTKTLNNIAFALSQEEELESYGWINMLVAHAKFKATALDTETER